MNHLLVESPRIELFVSPLQAAFRETMMSEPEISAEDRLHSIRPNLEKLKVSLDEFGPKVQALLRKRHAGIALVIAAMMDRQLEVALRTKMTALNSKLDRKLFGDYGSLRDFSTKIDLSFALGLIDSENYKRLTTIRKIRNVFAHSPMDGFVDFNTPIIQKLLLPFSEESPVTSDSEAVFLSIVKGIKFIDISATPNGETIPPSPVTGQDLEKEGPANSGQT